MTLIKTASFTLALLMSGSVAFAQNPESNQPSSQVEANFSARPSRVSSLTLLPAFAYGASQVSLMGGYPNTTTSATAGSYLEAGVLGEIGRGTFVFQTGLTYMRFAATVSSQAISNGVLYRGDGTGSFSYLGIPLAAKARLRVANGIRLAGRVGLTPALLLGSDGNTTSTMYSATNGQQLAPSQSSNSTSTSDMNGFNALAIIGAGPEIRINRDQNLRLEALYETMLISTEKQSQPLQAKFSTISAMLSYGIAI